MFLLIVELAGTLSSLCFGRLRIPASACLTVLGLVACGALADVYITMKSGSDMGPFDEGILTRGKV